MHHVFVLDASGSMGGTPWKSLKGAVREYIYNRIGCGATLDLVSVVLFDSSATVEWEARNITTVATLTPTYRGGGTSFAAALRAANEVLSRVQFDTFKPVIVFFSDGQPQDAGFGKDIAEMIAKSYAKYGLTAFTVGFGHVNLPVLEQVARRLGGKYYHALDGSELKTTFQSISASLGARAGLALTKPQHELICVICQRQLVTDVSTALAPCQHEFHIGCLELLADQCAVSGELMTCPTCRQSAEKK